MEPIYLHLGCGKRRLPHPPWINIDIDEKIHTEGYSDEYGGVVCLAQYADNSINAIYASHLLDHLSRNKKVDEALSEWYRVLEPGGILRIAVSDFEMVVKMYSEGLALERLWCHIVGGHKTKWDQHGVCFDYNTLKKYLDIHGFIDIKRYRWQDFLPEGFDDLSACYIPHMDKENGILMSLNVKATKNVI